jgi:hypothetical protein
MDDIGRRTLRRWKDASAMLTLAVGNKPVRALAVALMAAMASWAWAFSPPVGSEVLVTDRDGSTLIGFGVVRESGLALELSVDAPEWRVVIVAPDGWSSPYQASWDGQRLTFESAEGERVDVADALAAEGRGLTLAWWDGTRVDVPSDVVVAQESEGDDASVATASDAGEGSELADNRPDDDAVTTATDPRDDEDDGDDGDDGASADPPASDPDPDDPPTNRPDDGDDGDADDGDANDGDDDDGNVDDDEPANNRPDPPTNDGGDDGSDGAGDDSGGDDEDGGANRL